MFIKSSRGIFCIIRPSVPPIPVIKIIGKALERPFLIQKFNPTLGLNFINLNERITPTTKAKEGFPKRLNIKSKFLKVFKFPNKLPTAINITGTIMGSMDSLKLGNFLLFFVQKTNWYRTLIYYR